VSCKYISLIICFLLLISFGTGSVICSNIIYTHLQFFFVNFIIFILYICKSISQGHYFYKRLFTFYIWLIKIFVPLLTFVCVVLFTKTVQLVNILFSRHNKCSFYHHSSLYVPNNIPNILTIKDTRVINNVESFFPPI